MSDPSLVGVGVSVSPTTVYSGPPPPYSYSPTTASAHAGSISAHAHPHLLSPADSRRTSGDGKDTLSGPPPPTLPPSTRQSLPSIHEALKSGASFAYALTPATANLVGSPRPAHLDGPSPTTLTGTPELTRHDPLTTVASSPPPPRTDPTTQTTHPGAVQSHVPTYHPSAPPPGNARRISLPAIVPPDHRFPSLPPLRTGPPASSSSSMSGPVASAPAAVPPPPPPSSSAAASSMHFPPPSSRSDLPPPPPHHPAYSPRLERTPTSAGSMNPGFPYASYPPHYLYPPPPPPPAPPAPVPAPAVVPPRSPAFYPPVGGYSLSHAAPPTYPPSFVEREPHPVASERSGPGSGTFPENRNGPPESHGTSVKRHLEFLDVEASLKEVSDSGTRLVEFSREYGRRARDLQRTGPLPGVLPTIAECDEMIRHQQRIQDLLGRLRTMLVTEQTAVLHRRVQQDRPFKGDFEMEDPSGATDDAKANGVMPADARKRRGRAAPPGRCHSCNRAETPEWRRGPDGARTLCNACGLHYAKLTRKQGSKGHQGHSSLRPKPMAPGGHPPT